MEQRRVYYYTVNCGENGGVVIATSQEAAVIKLQQVYSDTDDISVWDATEDPHWSTNYPDVHERY